MSPTVIDQLKVRTDDSRSVLYVPLHNSGSQVVGFKILTLKATGEETVPAGGCGGVLSLRPVKYSKQEAAVIVPSVTDALALASSRISQHVICLPYGNYKL